MNTILPAFFNMIVNLCMLLLFLRFFVQLADIQRNDSVAEPFYRTTAIVDLFSSIFPDQAKGRFSLSAMALLFLVSLVSLWGNAWFAGTGYAPINFFITASLGFALQFISACQYVIIAMVIVSWIIMLTQNMHPLFMLVMRVAEPIIAPFRRITPNLGMIDLSPMIAIFALWMLEEIVVVVSQEILGML